MDTLTKLILVLVLVLCCCCLQGFARRSKGSWGEWSPLSPCSKSCDMGTQTRWREWVPGQGEPRVNYTNTEQYSCFQTSCPQNGSWTSWGMWSECTVGCGGGVRNRHRDCANPPPAYGGADCEGEKYDKEECNKTPCPPLPANFNMSVCKRSRMFMCANNKMCVKESLRCDDNPDCNDGSDELECRRYGSGLGRIRYSHSDSTRPTAVFSVVTTSAVATFIFARMNC